MKIFVLTGPTGVGKSEIGILLARKFGLEIISADSRAIYRYMDIGTAKPPIEIRQEVRFHLIDFVEPNRVYSAADFARDALKVIETLRREGKRFIVVGGAGFYLRALFSPLFETPPSNPQLRGKLQSEPTEKLYRRLWSIDPERARQLHPNDRQRIIRALEVNLLTGKTFSQLAQTQKKNLALSPVYAVLTMERKRLYRRIEERFDQMISSGLIEETRRLKEMGYGESLPVVKSYGYAELLRFLDGKISLEEAILLAKRRTKDYARRQLIWLRGLKKGVYWFEVTSPDATALSIEPLLINTLKDLS